MKWAGRDGVRPMREWHRASSPSVMPCARDATDHMYVSHPSKVCFVWDLTIVLAAFTHSHGQQCVRVRRCLGGESVSTTLDNHNQHEPGWGTWPHPIDLGHSASSKPTGVTSWCGGGGQQQTRPSTASRTTTTASTNQRVPWYAGRRSIGRSRVARHRHLATTAATSCICTSTPTEVRDHTPSFVHGSLLVSHIGPFSG